MFKKTERGISYDFDPKKINVYSECPDDHRCCQHPELERERG
jgi:hypothetical protein